MQDLDALMHSHLSAMLEGLDGATDSGVLTGEWPERYRLLQRYASNAVHAFAPQGPLSAEAICRAVDRERDRRTALDFAWDFGETLALDDLGNQIAAGVRHLQMRAADLRNWQIAQGAALTAVIGGQPQAVIPIRAEDNWNVQTTALQVLEVLAAVTERGVTLLMFGGALKTAVRSAEDPAAVDIYSGWPFEPVPTEPEPNE